MRRKEHGRPINVPFPLSLPFIALLFLGGALSIPYTWVERRIHRRRHRALEVRMQAQDRLMRWSDFIEALNLGHGTVIEEKEWFKRARVWWTPDNIYERSPYPIVDWLTMSNDPAYDTFNRWCYDRYTSPKTGTALLISTQNLPRDEASAALTRLESGAVAKVEIIDMEVLPRERRINPST